LQEIQLSRTAKRVDTKWEYCLTVVWNGISRFY